MTLINSISNVNLPHPSQKHLKIGIKERKSLIYYRKILNNHNYKKLIDFVQKLRSQLHSIAMNHKKTQAKHSTQT